MTTTTLTSQSAVLGNITDDGVADWQFATTIVEMFKQWECLTSSLAGSANTDSPTIPGESEYGHGSSLFIDEKRLKVLTEASKSIAVPEAGEKFLAEALVDLEELDDYAKEEELEPPSPIAKKLARELLEKLAFQLPREYAVSLWTDGDVIVYSGNSEWRVSIYYRANGGASFYVDSSDDDDDYKDRHYESASDMPIALILDALKKLSA